MMGGMTQAKPYGEGAVAYTNVTAEDYVMAEHTHKPKDEEADERTATVDVAVEVPAAGAPDEDAVDPGAPDTPAPDEDSSPDTDAADTEEEKEPRSA